MPRLPRSSSQLPLILLLLLMLGSAFFATSMVSYQSAIRSLRDAIVNTELPLTSDNIYSEIQKDLVRPVLIASMMARDTFVRDWILAGEQDPQQMTRYLREVQEHYGTFTSFLVSERSATYYQAKGILKQVNEAEPRDAWYYRVRAMREPYEINVDVDLANQDHLTFFINYQVYDYQQQFIGAAGVGLAVDSVVKLVDTYQARYERSIFFVDTQGRVTLTGSQAGPLKVKTGQLLSSIEGLEALQDRLPRPQSGNYQYREADRGHFLNVRYIPELDWYLFVDKHDGGAMAEIRRSLLWNLAISVLATLLSLTLVALVVRRYQRRIAALANTDQLTGLPNRRGFELLAGQALQDARRQRQPLCALMLDIDNFKQLNDQHGHLAGDQALRAFAAHLRNLPRQSDIVCRWGGEEFAILLKDSSQEAARQLAERLRVSIEALRLPINGQQLQMTVSIGLSQREDQENIEQLLNRADRALYRAKQSGRNRVCEASHVTG